MPSESPVNQANILVVDDEALLRRQITAFLERCGAEVTGVGDLAAARHALAAMAFDFAFLDVNLPDGLGTDLLREKAFPDHTSVVVMTAEGGVQGAVEAIRLGAVDYLTKPFEMGELPLLCARAARQRQQHRLDQHRREDETLREDEFVFGSSLAFLREQLERILAADRRMGTALAPVLVLGETGTGKTSIARWIHERGPRAAQPLVEVNCSALPEALAESELFGHERGAFTDARSARLGLFEAAHGGTLFLDELASLPLGLQAKVLTAIEDGRIRRVGGNRSLPVDTRLIAASNRNLHDLVARGAFREDLMHRLDLFRVQIPPLRERPADILPLANALMLRASRRHRLEMREITAVGRQRLESYRWPGNVRELAHEMERALVFEDGPLQFPGLQHAVGERAAGSTSTGAPAVGGTGASAVEPVATDWLNPAFRFPEQGFQLEEAITRLVRRAVDQSGGNVSAAARLLGVSRDVVRYRLEAKAEKVAEKSG